MSVRLHQTSSFRNLTLHLDVLIRPFDKLTGFILADIVYIHFCKLDGWVFKNLPSSGPRSGPESVFPVESFSRDSMSLRRITCRRLYYKLRKATLNRKLFEPLSDPLEDFTTILVLFLHASWHIHVVGRSPLRRRTLTFTSLLYRRI